MEIKDRMLLNGFDQRLLRLEKLHGFTPNNEPEQPEPNPFHRAKIGIKDKNGVDIREGDIVRHGPFIMEVVYAAPSFSLESINLEDPDYIRYRIKKRKTKIEVLPGIPLSECEITEGMKVFIVVDGRKEHGVMNKMRACSPDWAIKLNSGPGYPLPDLTNIYKAEQ